MSSQHPVVTKDFVTRSAKVYNVACSSSLKCWKFIGGYLQMEQDSGSVFNDQKYEYKLPDEWKKRASEELNENPETVLQELAVFREKVKDINGLRSRLDDCFLLAFLRAKKFDQKRALKTLKRFYEFRRTYPEYFETLLVDENKAFYDAKLFKIMEERDSLGRTLDMIRLGKCDMSKFTIDDAWRVVFTALDCLLLDQTFQVGGVVLILDFTDFGISHMRELTLKFIKVFCNVVLDTYPIRFKAIHVVNAPLYFHVAFKLFKPFVSKKMLSRLSVHGSEITILDSHINQEILPDFCGGTDTEFNNDWLLKLLEEFKDTLKENATKYGYHRSTLSINPK